MTQQDMNALLRFKRKVLRPLLGTLRIYDDEWRIKINCEIENEMSKKV